LRNIVVSETTVVPQQREDVVKLTTCISGVQVLQLVENGAPGEKRNMVKMNLFVELVLRHIFRSAEIHITVEIYQVIHCF